MKTITIIPAGGKGERSGSKTPKQYLKIFGKELIVYTLQIFQQNKFIDEIILAAEKHFFKLLDKLKNEYHLTKITKIVEGGNERQDSVFNALKSSAAKKNDLIIVHDAARPLLTQEVLTESIETAVQKGNALVCLRAKDTLIKGNKVVDSYLDRDEVYYVQTPQIFSYSILMKAMKNACEKNFIGTDESMLVRKIGERVYIVEGSAFNFKITTAEDIEMFEKIISKK